MALLLGADDQGIVPGPQLIKEHPDILGPRGQFLIDNILLVPANVPLIGIWVKLLTIP
jgi:TctA family transporter